MFSKPSSFTVPPSYYSHSLFEVGNNFYINSFNVNIFYLFSLSELFQNLILILS